ncbi:MAG: hypothetical protein DIU74_004765 [Pseudomonadota bacterium]
MALSPAHLTALPAGANSFGAARAGIIRALLAMPTMEAERINAISNTLEDLKERTAELRRYL